MEVFVIDSRKNEAKPTLGKLLKFVYFYVRDENSPSNISNLISFTLTLTLTQG